MESAGEAQARVIGGVLRKIEDDGRVTADMLPVGCAVRVEGEWYAFDGFWGGLMRLSNGQSGFTHQPADDDRFEWSSPF